MDMDTGYNIEKEKKRKIDLKSVKSKYIYIYIFLMSDFFFLFSLVKVHFTDFFFSNWNYLLKKLKLKK